VVLTNVAKDRFSSETIADHVNSAVGGSTRHASFGAGSARRAATAARERRLSMMQMTPKPRGASPGLYFEVSPTQGISDAMNALLQKNGDVGAPDQVTSTS
jgi:hypothetical protein